jgi:hypothetical protein
MQSYKFNETMSLIMAIKKSTLAMMITTTLLSACGGGSSDNSPQVANGGGGNFAVQASTLSAYDANSPYQQHIAACVTTASCTLERLPLIGFTSDSPTVEQIMSHVAVSHDWMGLRFKNMLETMPPQMLLLFRAVTAVVIGADIRPAHYRSDTGAIYIDPALLWLTNEEKATIDKTPDFRSNFGKDLRFIRVWRYIINNDYAWQSYSLEGNEERTIEDTLVLGSWVLYHELAHANDCASPTHMTSFDRSKSFNENHISQETANACVYQQLNQQVGLQSQRWKGLANVFFQGVASTSEQRALSAISAGDAFELDYALDAYSYSSLREDVAMSFEAVMMKNHFNADRDMAIIAQFDNFDCANAQIKWGQRGRMALPDVLARSEFVTERLLPEFTVGSFYQDLPTTIDINFDHNWCTPNLAGTTRFNQSMSHHLAESKVRYGIEIN